MNLIRRDGSQGSAYRPRSLDDQVGRIVEDMFEDLFSSTLMPYSSVSRTDQDVITPRVNLRETDKTYELEVDIPGIEKDDVRISIENRRVTIEAEEKMEATSPQGEGQAQSGQSGQPAQSGQSGRQGQQSRMERYYRRYAVSFMLPAEVDDTSAQARLEKGVLRLTLPKKQAAQAKKLTVQ
ncbi:MAG: Hsp20/alpha crystallin family protein [Pseudomonadota bacterium]